MKKEDSINRIIEVTTDLIQQSSGNPEDISIRKIAEQAGIGIGLIHYHFGSKEQLIEQCVQRMISTVITSFKPDLAQGLSPRDSIKAVSKLVLDFLMANPAISRISILGDHKSPKSLDNTMKTVKGFSYSLGSVNLSEKQKNMLLFAYTSILQSAFLRKDLSTECFGVDMNNKDERDRFLDFIIDRFLGDIADVLD